MLNAKKEIIFKWIDDNRDKILSDFKELVKIPTLTGEEKDGQTFMAAEFEKMGLKTDTWQPDIKELFDKYPEVAQYPSRWQPEFDLPLKFEDTCTYEQLMSSPYADILNYDERPNVVGCLKGENNSKGHSLILNGHIDVVTIGNPNEWDVAPFGAEEKDGIIYGRGSCDMKGGLWSMTKALDAIISCGIKLNGDIYLESVVNEEHSGNGSLSCVARGYKADAAIIPEPTGSRNFSKCSGGGIYWEIFVKGKEAHTGSRWKEGKAHGISAIEKLPKIINGLMRKEAKENKDEICLSMGIGMVRGGNYATSTAKDCTISGVAYFSPALGTGITGLRKIKQIFKDVIDEASAEDPWLKENPPVIKYLHYDDAYQYPESSGFADVLIKAGKDVTGEELNEVTFSACDARHLGNQGKIPAVVYGPGDISLAHSLNESIKADEIIESAKIIASAICDWCGIAQ